jgi:tripartite-type tricarboxylate transporter receptor subunit TctC
MNSKLIVRRSLLAGAALSPFLPALPGHAQSVIPDKGIRLLVGFGAGNGTDTVARQFGPKLERRTGRHITIENRVGTSGAAAGEALKKGPNDGTNLALLPSTTFAARIGTPDYPFDPSTDVAPISLIGTFPLAIAVSPRIGVTSYEQYVEFSRKPDPANRQLGSTALSDAFVQVYGKLMSHVLGADMKVVGYRGGSSMVADLEQGKLAAAISNLPTLLAAHRGGRCRIVLLTGDKPSTAAPQLPTAAKLGVKNLDMREWYMFLTGGKAPTDVVNAWNMHIRAVLNDPVAASDLTQLGLDVVGCTPEEARTAVDKTISTWRTRMESFGVAIN